MTFTDRCCVPCVAAMQRTCVFGLPLLARDATLSACRKVCAPGFECTRLWVLKHHTCTSKDYPIANRARSCRQLISTCDQPAGVLCLLCCRKGMGARVAGHAALEWSAAGCTAHTSVNPTQLTPATRVSVSHRLSTIAGVHCVELLTGMSQPTAHALRCPPVRQS